MEASAEAAGVLQELATVLIDTSARRETERIEAPSQSMARIWARLAIGSLFMLAFI